MLLSSSFPFPFPPILLSGVICRVIILSHSTQEMKEKGTRLLDSEVGKRHKGAQRVGAHQDLTASSPGGGVALQEKDLLEASILHVRSPQRNARGAKKLQSSFVGPPPPEEGASRPCATDAEEMLGQASRGPTISTNLARRCSLPDCSLDDCYIMTDMATRGRGSPQSLDLHEVSLAMVED